MKERNNKMGAFGERTYSESTYGTWHPDYDWNVDKRPV